MSAKKVSRQRRILAQLGQQPSLRVTDLARSHAVSTETIRRDLDELTSAGLIDRTYGGAVRKLSVEPGVSERQGLYVSEREAIAAAACPRLAGANHLFIGSGATTVHVARRIALYLGRSTVVTHSFGVANALSPNGAIEVLVAPGTYCATEGAMHGAHTLRYLDQFRVDWAVVGASGLTEEGASDAMPEAALVYTTMIERASKRMVVADASKFGKVFAARYAGYQDIDLLVADRAPSGALAEALAFAGVEVLIATSTPRERRMPALEPVGRS